MTCTRVVADMAAVCLRRRLERARNWALGAPCAVLLAGQVFEVEYLAFGGKGEYRRPAIRVGELPHNQIGPALRQAAANLGVSAIQFGVPIWRTLGMTKAQYANDRRRWLRFRGAELPLAYVNVYW